MKKLPIGITTFADIVDPRQNYVYVDKTHIAYDLIENGKYYFLSRPRRFGKSLFIDTLAEIFKGHQSLFTGLSIHQKWDWKTSYPVIHIDFNTGDFSTKQGLQQRIAHLFSSIKKTHHVDCDDSNDISRCFSELIEAIQQKYQQKVVILIDEYDKPILDNITDKPQAREARDLLRIFYGVIKSNDRYLKFVFITGVSKFSKMHLFSGLNNLEDITMKSDYATICGYTHEDLQLEFKDHLHNVDLNKVKQWYNGYCYFGEPVYNPYDILLFCSNHGQFENYWWETGNPRFLIDTLKEQHYYIPNLENIVVSKEILNIFDVDKIDLVALLWQTGYLTFDKKILNFDDTYSYKLKIPNREIQKSLNQLFIQYLTDHGAESLSTQENIYQSLTGDIGELKSTLNALFAAIPYNNYANNVIANYEGYYSSVVFTYISSLGFPCIAEDATNTGRIDLTIQLPERIIIIEFKVDQKERALQQIQRKRYFEKYLHQNKTVFIVGICFDSENKNISEFEYQQISE